MPRQHPFLSPFRLALAAALLSPVAAVATASPDQPGKALTDPMQQLAAMEARVATLAARLARGSARWCPRTMPTPGWLLGDRRLYGDKVWPVASSTYGAQDNDALFIAALDPGGAAARAGLRVGDSISAINDTPPPLVNGPPHARMAWAHGILARLPADEAVNIAVARLATPVSLASDPGCSSEFRVEAYDSVRAQADGEVVYIPAGMVRFAANDGELATVIAHELAHNILQHRQRLNAAGIDRGLGQQFGRSARLTRATEIEADRLSVWLLVDAGFGADTAARFWTSYGKRRGGGIFAAPTHPKWRERVRIVRKEAALMQGLRAANPYAVPPLVASPPPLE
jgi:beta-barrel assembly-enhancing protease